MGLRFKRGIQMGRVISELHVLAWQSTGKEALSGKSPKQALLKWLRKTPAPMASTRGWDRHR
jgi:hypothetical protein